MRKHAMLSVDDALTRLLADVIPLVDCEQVGLGQARGRVVAEDLISTLDVPAADNSSMDGYALRYADIAAGRRDFPVAQRIAAGAVGIPLAPGSVARVFTGAEIPPGADTVVMQENCSAADSRVVVDEAPEQGANVRLRGQDIARGAIVIERGTRLSAPHIGLLASIGLTTIPVRRRLRVAILSTGDELAEPGDALRPGQIYNSNRYLLAGLLEAMTIDVVDIGRVADTPAATRASLQAASEQADVIISTGGVSVGEEDHVKAAVEALGSLDLWSIAIKPGKPLAYGRIGGRAFFGLPGNPSSVFVTFLVFALPYLGRMQGVNADGQPRIRARADFEWPKPGRRQEYLRARLSSSSDGQRVGLYPNQSSGVLMSVAWANCLVELKPGSTVRRDDEVEVVLIPFS